MTADHDHEGNVAAFGLCPVERIMARTVSDITSGCVLWQGATNDHGYGQIRIGGRSGTVVYVHRLIYELTVGPIPEGRELDHVTERGCVHRNCVNIDHLEPVTHRLNVLRGGSPAARQSAQATCLRGHDLGDAYITRDGRRQCRECTRFRQARARAAKRGQVDV